VIVHVRLVFYDYIYSRRENNFQDEILNKVNLNHLENVRYLFVLYEYYNDLIDY
jgi:hypothetical protein